MRKKQAKPLKYDRKYRKYSPETLLKAYETVKTKGASVRKVAQQFGVPEQTLRDRVKGNIDPVNFSVGGETVFSHDEELTLVEHVEVLAQLGYGATNTKLQHLGGDLAFVLKKRSNSKPLSNCWLYGFMKRWEHRINSIRPRALETNRAKAATPENVDSYFRNLQQTIHENQLEGKPQFIYNLDETGIQPEHRPPNVIAPVNSKPQAVTSPRSTTTTVIGCANAAGNHLPPFFIFKGKRYNPELMKGAAPGSKGVMSESGWSNSQVFRDYLETHFLPNVRRGSNDNQKILLLFDGHTSHVSKQLIEWAISKDVILFVLPAHTSHLLQPLDVGIFGPFKTFYYSECASFMQRNFGRSVTRYEMAEIASRAYLKAMTPNNIVSAFRKAGVHPVSRESIPMEKLFPSESFRDTTPVQKVKAMKTGREAVEEYLQMKLEWSQKGEDKPQADCACQCSCSKMKKTTPASTSIRKPNPSGKAITDISYLDGLSQYEENKENENPQRKRKLPTTDKKQKKKEPKKKTVITSPKPFTSGLNVKENAPDSDDDSICEESEPCCVCHKFSPPNLNDRPYLKIVTWAQCVECSHWVHLSFCHEKRVVRRGETFLCPHCN